MALIQTDSLSETLSAVNDAFLHGRALSRYERTRTARWIAARQGLPGAYAGSFALLPDEVSRGIRLLTGERARSAAARHIAGQEACRALRMLAVDEPHIVDALSTAGENLEARVGPIAPRTGSSHWFDGYRGGVFCCGRCSVALWRHIAAGGFDDREPRLAVGLSCLQDARKDDHTWSRFPFWYTVSALIEMPSDLPREHLRHAAPRLERLARRGNVADAYAARRGAIARRALEIV